MVLKCKVLAMHSLAVVSLVRLSETEPKLPTMHFVGESVKCNVTIKLCCEKLDLHSSGAQVTFLTKVLILAHIFGFGFQISVMG